MGSAFLLILVLLVCTPLGWALLFGLFTLIAQLGPKMSPEEYAKQKAILLNNSSDNTNDVGNSFQYYPYNTRSDELNAHFAEKQEAQRNWDEKWEQK